MNCSTGSNRSVLEKLSDDLKVSVIEICAKVAENHHKPPMTADVCYRAGYNDAAAEIAAAIRGLK